MNFTAPNKAFIFKINWVHENVVTIKDAAFHQVNYYGKWRMPYTVDTVELFDESP